MREIYNATLERNWGFIPDLDGRSAGFRGRHEGVCRPGDDVIAEINGENAGVALSLPNFNEILARIKKTPHLLQIAAHFLADENSSDQLRTAGRSWNFSAVP